jgi:preprotein translocase subunit SecG
MSGMPWFVWIVWIIQLLVSIGLIIAVVSQTTKHEGLGGTIGGRSSSSFRGRPGLEDQLQRITMYLAIAFMVTCILSFLLQEMHT